MKTSLLFSLLCLVICGCSIPNKHALKDTSFIGGTEKGAVVISIKCPMYGLSRPSPYFDVRDKNKKWVTCIKKESETAKSFWNDGVGYLDVLELPAGDYEICSCFLYFNTGMAQWYEFLEEEVLIPFKIEAGKLNYLGEMAFEKYQFKFRDKHDRDLTIAYKNYPGLSNADMVYYQLICQSGCINSPKRGKKTINTPPPPPPS